MSSPTSSGSTSLLPISVDPSVTVDNRVRLDRRVSLCDGVSGCIAYPYTINGRGSHTPSRGAVVGAMNVVVTVTLEDRRSESQSCVDLPAVRPIYFAEASMAGGMCLTRVMKTV